MMPLVTLFASSLDSSSHLKRSWRGPDAVQSTLKHTKENTDMESQSFAILSSRTAG